MSGRIRLRADAGVENGTEGPFLNLLFHIRGRDHEDGFPGANFCAGFATDAAFLIYFDDAHEVGVFDAGDLLDAVDRTDGDASVAAGAAFLIDDRIMPRWLFSFRFTDRRIFR